MYASLLLCVFLLFSTVGAQSEGSTRLVGSFSSSSEGRLEIYYRGQWGTVCDDGFFNTEANVACRELGYRGASSYGSSFSLGYGTALLAQPIWLDDVNCLPTASAIRFCSHNTIGVHNCRSDHREDIALRCTNIERLSSFRGSKCIRKPGGLNQCPLYREVCYALSLSGLKCPLLDVPLYCNAQNDICPQESNVLPDTSNAIAGLSQQIINIIIGVSIAAFVLFIVIPVIICVVVCVCVCGCAGVGAAAANRSSRHPRNAQVVTTAPATTSYVTTTTNQQNVYPMETKTTVPPSYSYSQPTAEPPAGGYPPQPTDAAYPPPTKY